MKKLNFEKLNGLIKNRQSLSEDELKVRDLLELCSNPSKITSELLDGFKYKHFLAAKREILLGVNSRTIQDMSIFEYAKDNVTNCETVLNLDEDIY